MTSSDNPDSTTEPTSEPIVSDNLDDDEAFQKEAERAEIEAALEKHGERTFQSDGVR